MAKDKVKSAVKDAGAPDALASLEGIQTVQSAPVKTSKKKAHPTLVCTGNLAEAVDVYTAGVKIEKIGKSGKEANNETVKDAGRDFFIETGLGLGCAPESPVLQTERSSVTHCEVTGQKIKVHVAITDNVAKALEDAGVSKRVVGELAPLVKVQPYTTIHSLQELREAPETLPLYNKVVEFLMSLPPDEKARVVDNKPKFVVDPTFLDVMFSTIKGGRALAGKPLETAKTEVAAVMTVVAPQKTTTGVDFRGSEEQALEVLHNAVTDSETTKTVKTVKTVTTEKVAA